MSSDEFESPDENNEQTNYGLNYSNRRSTRIAKNDEQPSTSRAATSRKTATRNTRSLTLSLSPIRLNNDTGQGSRNFAAKSTGGRRTSPRAPLERSRRKQSRPVSRTNRLRKEIRILQERTDNITPKLPFGRLVREILSYCGPNVRCITREALQCLHESAELYVTQQLEDAYVLTIHRGRVTLSIQDMRCLRYFRPNL